MPSPEAEKKEKPSGLSTRGAVLVGVGAESCVRAAAAEALKKTRGDG